VKRVPLAAMALSLVIQVAYGQPADDAIAQFKSCLAREGDARVECLDKLSRELSGGSAPALLRTNSGNWIVSETTSPVDYSPQMTATILSESTAKGAPTSLTVRCRGQRTELLVNTAGTWRPSYNGEFKVAYRIDDQPAVEARWTAFARGRGAVFKGDVIRFVQSLPEGARLSISVYDWQGPAHEATFQMSGLDAVRQKISMACK